MRLFLLTALTMVAFAANSVLNRMALADGLIEPGAFGAVRLASGAVALAVLVAIRDAGVNPGLRARAGIWGLVTLALYVIGFSFAYITLDTGTGALILFGGVQVTMFLGAVLLKETVPPARWLGAALAFVGLCVLFWPGGAGVPNTAGAALMAAAALGWGIYSLIGRGAADPLGGTARNFIWAVPLGLLPLILGVGDVEARGVWLAVISGVVTSGLGYALWYSVLPRLEAALAAVAQLTVPVIAALGGVLLLGESLSWRFAVAAGMVAAGVLLSVRWKP